MIIVGVGAGPQMLTAQAIQAVAQAKIIYGSKRAIDLVQEHIDPKCTVKVIEDYKRLNELPQHAVVLSTGDPMLSGLGYLEGKVIPGISSLQVACARCKISELRVVPITAHGRNLDYESIAFELSRGKIVFLLTDDTTDMQSLCQYLEVKGLHKEIAMLTDLGYDQERITRTNTANPPKAPGLSCVLIGDF